MLGVSESSNQTVSSWTPARPDDRCGSWVCCKPMDKAKPFGVIKCLNELHAMPRPIVQATLLKTLSQSPQQPWLPVHTLDGSRCFDMATLSLSTPEGFEQLMSALTSRDNATRQAAEDTYASLKETPDALAQHLIRALRQSQHDDVRSMCAIMLRRVRQHVFLVLMDTAEPDGGFSSSSGCSPATWRASAVTMAVLDPSFVAAVQHAGWHAVQQPAYGRSCLSATHLAETNPVFPFADACRGGSLAQVVGTCPGTASLGVPGSNALSEGPSRWRLPAFWDCSRSLPGGCWHNIH